MDGILTFFGLVARKGKVLLGSNIYEESLIDQWTDYSTSLLEPSIITWCGPIFGYYPFDAAATDLAKKTLTKNIDALNRHLLKHTYLVGESISLADIIVALTLAIPYKIVFDSKYRKTFPNVTRWFKTVIGQPNVAALVGPIELCTEMQVAKPAPVAETKPAETVEEAPKKEDKKKSNPLDSLPPTTFNLHKFKDVYSNEDTRSKALPWLWENLDKEGWSFWFADYKYNEELTKTFMSANLIGGFFQRLEFFNKYSFASVCIFGEDGNLKIAGAFLVRGTEFPWGLKPEEGGCDDADVYSWRKADLENAADKALVEDFLAWDGEFGGKYPKFNQGKVFK